MKRIAIALLAVLVLGMLIAPAAGLSVGHVGGKGLKAEVSPGESYTQTLLARIGEDEEPTDVVVEVLGYGYKENGEITYLFADEDTSPYSGRTFISPARSVIHVEPGEVARTEVIITIPPDVGEGGHYAVLRFSTDSATQENEVTIVSEILLPMRFTVAGSRLIPTAAITGVECGEAVSNKPVAITMTVQNTGNIDFLMKYEVDVLSPEGTLLDTIVKNSTLSPIPGMAKPVRAVFVPGEELEVGTYAVNARIYNQDDDLLAQATGSFEVNEPYVPPPPPVTKTVLPSSETTVATADGRISVIFPKGSVYSSSEVTLESVPSDQVRSLPDGCAPTTTAFSVTGIAGLLAKDAQVSVRYCEADLAAAGGDASQLHLAQWSEIDHGWVIRPTEVDAGAMTLTTTSNHMSTWAVIVASDAAAAQSQQASQSGTQASPIAPLLPVAALLVIIIGMRGKKPR